jgi:hypothetical protein
MEGVEFYNINGKTCICRDGVTSELTPKDRDAIEWMLGKITQYFPKAVERLKELASASEPERWYYEFRIVDRFIRCNFGEADFLQPDVEMDMFHLEEVRCPLRGICKDEHVICKPRISLSLPMEEKRVVLLYAKGLLPSEIAARLGKKEKTCKQQIWKACKRLKLPHPRWLIRLFGNYNEQ